MSKYKFIKAANFTPSNGRDIMRIVLHSMEAPEKGETAENVARYFQRPEVRASAHYNIDNNSVVQSVLDKDVAWGAPGANRNSLHIEHAGYARQSEAEWTDPYSLSMLDLSARLCAELCEKYNIPPVWLTPADLKAGRRGITSHHNCSLAFGGSHTDPGVGFPLKRYLALVQSLLVAKLSEADVKAGMAALRVLYGLTLPPEAKVALNSLRDCTCWPPRK